MITTFGALFIMLGVLMMSCGMYWTGFEDAKSHKPEVRLETK